MAVWDDHQALAGIILLSEAVARFIISLAGGLDQQRHGAELVERKEAGMTALALHGQWCFELQLIPGIGFGGWCRARLKSQQRSSSIRVQDLPRELIPNGGMIRQARQRHRVGYLANAAE